MLPFIDVSAARRTVLERTTEWLDARPDETQAIEERMRTGKAFQTTKAKSMEHFDGSERQRVDWRTPFQTKRLDKI